MVQSPHTSGLAQAASGTSSQKSSSTSDYDSLFEEGNGSEPQVDLSQQPTDPFSSVGNVSSPPIDPLLGGVENASGPPIDPLLVNWISTTQLRAGQDAHLEACQTTRGPMSTSNESRFVPSTAADSSWDVLHRSDPNEQSSMSGASVQSAVAFGPDQGEGLRFPSPNSQYIEESEVWNMPGLDIDQNAMAFYAGSKQMLQSVQRLIQNGFRRTPRHSSLLEAVQRSLLALQPKLASAIASLPFFINDHRYNQMVRSLRPNLNEAILRADYFDYQTLSADAIDMLFQFLPRVGRRQYALGVIEWNPDMLCYNCVDESPSPDPTLIIWVNKAGSYNDPNWHGLNVPQSRGTAPRAALLQRLPAQQQSRGLGAPPLAQASSSQPPPPSSQPSSVLKRKRGHFDNADDQPTPKRREYQRRGVDGAPPHDSDLPFEHMEGITSEELILYFPNHVLRWPAICARICEDGYTAYDITNLINQHRRRDCSEGRQVHVVDAQSVQADVEALNREFHGDLFWATIPRPSIPKDKYVDTPWTMGERNDNLIPSSSSLRPPWTLLEIGSCFGERGHMMPGAGSFKDKVATAVDHQGRIASAILTPNQPLSLNPPLLPLHWKSAIPIDSSIQFQAGVPTSNRSDTTSRALRNKAHAQPQSSFLTRESLDPAIRDNPRAIMNKPEICTGEVFLWLISKNGGRQLCIDVNNAVNGGIRERNNLLPEDSPHRVKQLDRTTFNQRKRSALMARAQESGNTYPEEQNRFNRDEAFRRPAHRN